ncbi:CpaF family protein [Candidatus Ruminimicrobium bovinum]|uniref:CpaF family protein n=1 Tax=Candidatus Ruminimicrobium bovinum TaxID=3242779 RepID=UPI0039B9B054
MQNSRFISVIQADNSVYLNTLLNGLMKIFSYRNKKTILIDLRGTSCDVVWKLYGTEKIKYIDYVLGLIENINKQMLQTYLNGSQEILCIKNYDIILNKNLNYFFEYLYPIYDNIILVTSDKLLNDNFKIFENTDIMLLPFINEPVSFDNYKLNVGKILKKQTTDIQIIPLKFITNNIFDISTDKNDITFDYIDNEVLNPAFLFKDQSNKFVQSLKLLVEKINNIKEHNYTYSDFYDLKQNYNKLKEKLHFDLLEKMKRYSTVSEQNKLKEIILQQTESLLKIYKINLKFHLKKQLIKELSDDIVGLGVIEDLISDDTISEIMVNGTEKIYIEKHGKLFQTDICFQNEKKLKTVIDKIASFAGRHIDEASPLVDARLKDGSRVNAIIAPVVLNGPILTIRKFSKHKLSYSDLISFGSINEQMIKFLKLAVEKKKNILISGGTGTGKTTFLNILSGFIGKDERIITIEDSAELQLQQKHVIRLEARAKSIENTGEITIRQLLINSLRMRPDRIIVGECRSAETLDMLQAMNTGHDGSMTTVHSNSCSDAISRLVVMALTAGVELPEKSITSMIASAINIIVQIKRFPDGTRKIYEIVALEKDKTCIYKLIPIFKYDEENKSFNIINIPENFI